MDGTTRKAQYMNGCPFMYGAEPYMNGHFPCSGTDTYNGFGKVLVDQKERKEKNWARSGPPSDESQATTHLFSHFNHGGITLVDKENGVLPS